jgi:hypothetical protein
MRALGVRAGPRPRSLCRDPEQADSGSTATPVRGLVRGRSGGRFQELHGLLRRQVRGPVTGNVSIGEPLVGRYAHLFDKLARTGLLGLRCAGVPFNAVIARRQKLSHFPLVSVQRFALSVGGALFSGQPHPIALCFRGLESVVESGPFGPDRSQSFASSLPPTSPYTKPEQRACK